MDRPSFRHFQAGEKPSASEYNRLVDLAAGIANSLHIQGYADSTGFHTRRTPSGVERVKTRIFVVQSEAAGDGVYNCFEQTLDATEWADTAGDPKFDDKDAVSIEVLNLAEYDPEATYVAQLAAGDLIAAWIMRDDEGNRRWVGVPFRQSAHGNGARLAYCKDNAGAATTIACYLDTDVTGTEITVQCSIAGGGNLNAAIPRLTDGLAIIVTKIGASWYCTAPFQALDETKGLYITGGKLAVNIDTDELQFSGANAIQTKLDECPLG